jgi:DNA-directed RNA polymerase specialized sigma24 family protein
LLERIEAALPTLPSPLHGEVLRLHYLKGLDSGEISERLKLDPRKIRRLRAEAVALMAGLLGGGHAAHEDPERK